MGSITHELIAKNATDYVSFDVWNLTITDVQSVKAGSALEATTNGHKVNAPGMSLNFTITAGDPGCGQVLVIDLGQTYPKGHKGAIQIFYSTQMDAMALTWLNANQTYDKT